MNPSDQEEKLFGIVLSDVLISFAAFLFMLFVVISLQPHNDMDNSNPNAVAGRLCAEISWDNNRDVDLDIWGKSPADQAAVGYSNMHGGGLDLYRDVVGWISNPEKINLEIMCANKIYDGQWIFNVHYFSKHNPHDETPIKVVMLIRFKTYTGVWKNLRTEYIMLFEKQEKTLFSFRVKDGIILENTINSNDVPLRSN